MLKKFILSLCCASAFISTATLAVQYELTPKVEMEITLHSHVPANFTNSFFRRLKATCTVKTPEANNTIKALMTKKGAIINGQPLGIGESMEIVVHGGDTIHIDAEVGSTAQLTNEDANDITALCVTD